MIKTQFSKFLMVGATSTALNYLFFLILLNFLDINFLIASTIGYSVGLVFGYYFNKSWTFKLEQDSNLIKFKYFLIYMISLLSGLALLNTLVVKLSILIEIANVMVIVYTTLSNFIGTKFLVFKK